MPHPAKVSRVIRPALLVVALLLVARVVSDFASRAGLRLGQLTGVIFSDDIAARLPIVGSARLILATVAVAAVAVALDRAARR